MENLIDIYAEARQAAIDASNNEEMAWRLAGRMDACGFASVKIYKYNDKTIRSNSKLGKALEQLGIKKSSYERCYSWWNPSENPTQEITVKEVGARAAAEVLKSYGFTAYLDSRLD
jgi:hypothetical protein